MSQPYKTILAIDYETAWCRKSGYSLSVITNEEYVRDKRFKAWGLCYKEVGTNDAPVWITGKDIQRWSDSIDWSTTAVLAHNAQFDISVLSWIHGAKPCFIFDTLSMARALRGVEVGNSLAFLAREFELPPKGNAVYSTDGMLDSLTPGIEKELADYCAHDTWLCEQIFLRWIGAYPKKELRLISMTLKMYTNAMLVLDPDMLLSALLEEKEKREELLLRLGVMDEELSSNNKFAEVLRSVGVSPPTKKKKPTVKTPNPVGVNFAFAKTDALFQAMLNGENEDVAMLCDARLKVKSTTERTRAQRFLDISGRGALPVPLSYYGAKSGRYTASRGSAINMQNLKRGSFLRKAIMAPEGYQLVVGDLSQIEPRVLAWLADYDDLLDVFRAGSDPYAAFGAQMFNIPGMTKNSHPVQRQSAKSALLGAGYGLGWASFSAQLLAGFLGAPPLRYVRAEAEALGANLEYIERFTGWEANLEKMAEIAHTYTDDELLIHCVTAKKIIDIYRATAWPVVAFWNMCSELLVRSLAGGEEVRYKCLTFKKEEILLPNGMSLLYPNLRQQKDEAGKQQWIYGPDATKLYPGKITNNVTQAIARIVMTDGMLRVEKKYPIVGTVHDELLTVVPDDEVTAAKTWVLAQMTMEPSYLPGLPLAADGGAHRRYGLAKN